MLAHKPGQTTNFIYLINFGWFSGVGEGTAYMYTLNFIHWYAKGHVIESSSLVSHSTNCQETCEEILSYVVSIAINSSLPHSINDNWTHVGQKGWHTIPKII